MWPYHHSSLIQLILVMKFVLKYVYALFKYKYFFTSAVTFDRFIAIQSPLNYHEWVTKKRASVAVALILGITCLLGVLPVLTKQLHYSTSSQCMYPTLYPRPFVLGASCYFIVAIVITVPLYIQVGDARDHDLVEPTICLSLQCSQTIFYSSPVKVRYGISFASS